MIYLLQANDTKYYMLFERKDNIETFYNNGRWSSHIPKLFTDGASMKCYTISTGKIINWWGSKYEDTVDAKVVVRCKTQEGYLKWCTQHPELFI